MSRIRAELAEIERVSRQMAEGGRQVGQTAQQLRGRIQGMSWQGRAREEFMQRYGQTEGMTRQLAEMMADLSRELQHLAADLRRAEEESLRQSRS
ncbi:WXG100 family type VII secretion target [Paenibacillus mucilaginosus]|uniref:ESAT-6-like protein n=1 Tax=Paenibacillus mucilaginosus (strain KNP414) TaxID=1036673 RepID=F8FM17_PAEMK|nr:WXG100 family type VII secretion target [Paenibacillus mucilaginosus]AEI45643.1 hypothetical protein KNP414_07133 [Paenibacillus mucilaginosus KNP414]MCG7215159.1 WXG100 family type VII secretion target [Paenibacillus mucilaginosus]WDM27044.1 WXG100 family type VII secretion target [Paenibacillus mucilaginosus]